MTCNDIWITISLAYTGRLGVLGDSFNLVSKGNVHFYTFRNVYANISCKQGKLLSLAFLSMCDLS